MDCPRCGSPNEPGDRFCSSCGGVLTRTAPEKRRSWRERLGELLGSDRRTRLVSGATGGALVVAVAAFIALDQAGEDTIPRDAYTIAADQMCVGAKRQIVALESGGFGADASGTATFARRLLPVVAQWRSEFDGLRVPADRVGEARDLDGALQEVELRIGALARAAGEGDRKQTLVRARAADEASTGVEKAVSALGLSRCSRLTIGLTQE